MQLSLMIEGQEGVTWDDWVRLARLTEESGLEGLFRSDHYTAIIRPDADAHDAWATLAGLAALTERIRLGTMVSPATFRHPSVLARMVVWRCARWSRSYAATFTARTIHSPASPRSRTFTQAGACSKCPRNMDVVLAAPARCFFSKTLDALGVQPDASYAELDPSIRDVLVLGRPIATD